MQEEIRYYSRLGEYEQEINIPISQLSNEELKEFAKLFLISWKENLSLMEMRRNVKETKKNLNEYEIGINK